MRALPIVLLLLVGAVAVFAFTLLGNQASERELSGTLTRDGERFLINGTELGLGPWRHVSSGLAPADLDGDGIVETVELELDGLVGSIVTVENLDPVENSLLDLDDIWKRLRRGDFTLGLGDDTFEVHLINGIEYRLPDQPPPWSNDPGAGSGTPVPPTIPESSPAG